MSLKVNFKTKILEWKRKYNNLVDSVTTTIDVDNIETLTDSELNSLKVGDIVRKKTGNQKHCYIVTYKEENHGICLSYFDCGYLETISYDYTDGHWLFNSKDVQETQSKLISGTNIKTINGNSILGSGNLDVGTKRYLHKLIIIEKDEHDNKLITTFMGISNNSKLPSNTDNLRNYYIEGLSLHVAVFDVANELLLPRDYDIKEIIGLSDVKDIFLASAGNTLKVNVPPEINVLNPFIYVISSTFYRFDFVSFVQNLRNEEGYEISISADSSVIEL